MRHKRKKLILHDWQRKAMKDFFDKGGLALNVDTGLGKSILAVALSIEALEKQDTVIIVTPPHLISDLKAKFEEFFPAILPSISIANKSNKVIKPHSINILSYNKFVLYSKEIEKSLKKTFSYTVIYDESHLAKSVSSKTYKFAIKITNKYNTKNLLTTATMMSNNNLDLFSPAYLASKELRAKFNSYYTFKDLYIETEIMYIASRQIHKPLKISDAGMNNFINPNITKLQNKLLLSASETIISCPSSKQVTAKLKQLKDYEITQIDFSKLTAIETNRLTNIIANPAGKFLQLANNFIYDEITNEAKYFKYKEKLDLLNSIVNTESTANKKGILFYFFKAELDKLQSFYAKNKRIYWHNNKKDIVGQITEFEQGKYDLFVMNIAAASTGIRFKETDYIVHFNIGWNTLAIKQADGRLNYNGRTKPYKIFRFETDNEELKYIGERVREKQNKAQQWKEEECLVK